MLNCKTSMLAACLSLAWLSLGVHAQSTSGNIIGDASAGDTIFVTGPATGFKREVKIKKSGKFQVRNLPAGTYQVIPMHEDGSFEPSQQIDVRPGASVRVMPRADHAEANTP